MDALTHHKLTHAVTEYDRKQAAKKGYNIYALSHYLGAVQDAVKEYENGKGLREALVSHFNGRLLDVCLRSVGLAVSTELEQKGSL